MPNPLILPIGPGMKFKVGSTTYNISDHNRSELSIDKDRIENRKRMADGTMRTFVVAQKRNFKASWKNIPRDDIQTADGFWGAQSMKDFYDTTLGSFELILTDGNNDVETVLVMFDSFGYKLNKRSVYTDLYDIDMSLAEV
jgi:hypothetical protein